MTQTPVRRLALDMGPWVLAYYVFMVVMVLIIDALWEMRPFESAPLLPGLLVVASSGFLAQKIPLWRTLPVTHGDIDRARWWQTVGGPGVALTLLLVGPALVLAGLGRVHAGWGDIALAAGGQFAACVTITAVTVAMPLAGRKWGARSGLLLVPIFLLFTRFGILRSAGSDMHTVLVVASGVGLAGAALLYMTAGRWPLPLTVAIWALPASGAAARVTDRRWILRGWPVLVLAQLPVLALGWGAIIGFPLMFKWVLGSDDPAMMGWLGTIMMIPVTVSSIAIAMRILRALPISGLRLTCCLFFFQLMVQVISLAIYAGTVRALGGGTILPAMLVLEIASPSLFLALTLRLGLNVTRYGFGLMILIFMPLQLFNGFSTSFAVAGVIALIVMAGSFAWIHWELVHGRGAYRAQPWMPMRWRGTN